jgi:hypothetical protein
MAGISLILQNNPNVTQINCGTSSPRLGGTVDISAFPNLQQFRCNQHDITALSGYAQNSNLTLVEFFQNQVTGSIPSLSGLNNLQTFRCNINQLTGPIPSLSGLNNLRAFRCDTNQLTGSIPSLSGLNNLQFFGCDTNQLTGPIPSLSGLNNLRNFRCDTNQLTGSIPSLSGLTNLQVFRCQINQLTGPIPSLSGLTNLQVFECNANQLTGSIPSLSGLNNFQTFRGFTNQLTGFNGGPVSNTLGSFQAQNNQLPSTSVNVILSAFVAANKTAGTRLLNLGGTGNAAPSYTGGVTTTSPGTNFTRFGTLVTVTDNITPHGHVTGNIVTITVITPTAFQGTFAVTRITDNQFQYTTISSGAATGAGTATMRRTTNSSDGYASYQNLALVSRTGGPWTITINQP